jgi:hypothetical protein
MHKNSTQPLTVTILAIFVLFITSWNGIRAYSAIANWQVLKEFGANPVYLLATGLFWAITGLWLFRAIWKGYRYAFRAGLTTAGLYTLWYWCDRLIFQPAQAPNIFFSIFMSVVFLAFFIITLCLPASKAFFTGQKDAL